MPQHNDNQKSIKRFHNKIIGAAIFVGNNNNGRLSTPTMIRLTISPNWKMALRKLLKNSAALKKCVI
jgi:hypothetical protein